MTAPEARAAAAHAEDTPLAVDVRRVTRQVAVLVVLAVLTTLGGLLLSENLRAANNGRLRPAVTANDALLKDTLTASAGLRGFIATHQEAFLRSPTPDEPTLRADLARVRDLTGADSAALLADQPAALDAWLASRSRQIAAQRTGAPDGTLTTAPLARFQAANEATHRQLQARVDRQVHLTTLSIVGSSGLLTGELVLLALLINGLRRRLDEFVVHPLEELRAVVTEPGRRAEIHHGPAEIRALAAVVNTHLDDTQRAAEDAALEQRLGAVKDVTALAVRRSLDLPAVLAELENGLATAFPGCTVEVVGEDEQPDRWVGQGLSDERVLVSNRDSGFRGDDGVRGTAAFGGDGEPARLSAFVRSAEGPAALAVITSPKPRTWHPRETQLVEQLCDYATRGVDQARYDAARAETITRLEMLDRQKSDFMATVSHELRTPLTSIAGYLELIEDGDYGDLNPGQAQVLGIVARNTARLRALIEDLLVLSRIEANGVDLDLATFDLALLADVVAENLGPQAAAGGVAVIRDDGATGDDAMTTGDLAQVERALTNIIGNAVKFTPGGGTVHVTVNRTTDGHEVVVTDTGIGIPAGDLEDIGRRFFRASNVTEQTIPGTGLGLSIVRAIAEAHHGGLRVTSRAGEGTTVTLALGSPVSA